MKKIILFAVAVLMSMSMLSCDIDEPRPYSGTVYVELQDIPAGIGAVSIWCNENNWKTSEVTEANGWVVPVEDGKALFTLNNYVLSVPLQFQFTPMKTIDTKLGDDWWNCAISGSSQYAKDKNNMYCDFVAKGADAGVKLVVSKSSHGASGWTSNFPCYPDNPARKHTDNYKNCFNLE